MTNDIRIYIYQSIHYPQNNNAAIFSPFWLLVLTFILSFWNLIHYLHFTHRYWWFQNQCEKIWTEKRCKSTTKKILTLFRYFFPFSPNSMDLFWTIKLNLYFQQIFNVTNVSVDPLFINYFALFSLLSNGFMSLR